MPALDKIQKQPFDYELRLLAPHLCRYSSAWNKDLSRIARPAWRGKPEQDVQPEIQEPSTSAVEPFPSFGIEHVQIVRISRKRHRIARFYSWPSHSKHAYILRPEPRVELGR